jgi:hypothetical protein
VNEFFPRYALIGFGQACAGDEGFKAGRVVGVEDMIFAGSRLLLEILFVGRVVHDAESYEDGKKDVHKAVDFFRNVDLYKCFDAKDDKGGEGRPEGPGFETVLHNVYLLLSVIFFEIVDSVVFDLEFLVVNGCFFFQRVHAVDYAIM